MQHEIVVTMGIGWKPRSPHSNCTPRHIKKIVVYIIMYQYCNCQHKQYEEIKKGESLCLQINLTSFSPRIRVTSLCPQINLTSFSLRKASPHYVSLRKHHLIMSSDKPHLIVSSHKPHLIFPQKIITSLCPSDKRSPHYVLR